MKLLINWILLLQFYNLVLKSDAEMNAREAVKFFKCLACGKGMEGIEARSAFMLCRRMLPSKLRRLERECERKAIPGVELKSDVWIKACKVEGIAKKISDCVMKNEKEANLSKTEKIGLREFKKCAEEVNVEHCHVLPPRFDY